MRKIERDMINGINRLIENPKTRAFNRGNTAVRVDKISETTPAINVGVYLHGNHIADIYAKAGKVKALRISNAGWGTVTTRSRLNAILDVYCGPRTHKVYQRNYEQYLMVRGDEYEMEPGSWYTVVVL